MKITYWITTSLIAIFLMASAYSYVFHKATIEGVRALGFPDFFRLQLAVLKVIAVALLLLPFVSLQMKEWAYAGAGLFLITALVAHIAHKDSPFISLFLVVLCLILAVSNYSLHQLLKVA